MELQLKKGQRSEQFNIENVTVHLQTLKGVTVCCLCGWYTSLQQLQPNKIKGYIGIFNTAILLQSDVLCNGRHWNECLTRATWLRSWCCWLRRCPWDLFGPWDDFDKDSDSVTIEADRTWEHGTCSSGRGGCREPFWLLGLETTWFSWAATGHEFSRSLARLSLDVWSKMLAKFSYPDCPTIQHYSYSKSCFNAHSFRSYRSAIERLLAWFQGFTSAMSSTFGVPQMFCLPFLLCIMTDVVLSPHERNRVESCAFGVFQSSSWIFSAESRKLMKTSV